MECWNKKFSGILIILIGVLLIIYSIKYNRQKSFVSITEEYEFKYLSTLKSKPYAQTKIILLYTKLYHDNWGISSGSEIFNRLRCPVRDCYVSNLQKLQPISDALIFHMRDNLPFSQYPRIKPKGQRWIFYLMESPYHIWDDYSKFNGYFDWTSTYTRDSDIPAPYGRFDPFPHIKFVSGPMGFESTQDHQKLIKNYAAGKTEMALWMVSHCLTTSQREKVVLEMAHYLSIDVYGCDDYFKKSTKSDMRFNKSRKTGIVHHSGSEACPFVNHPGCLRTLGPHFKFYLALENSLCKEYITEKFWYNALGFDMVPVVMGAPLSDYQVLAPPGSFIHIDNFPDIRSLSNYLIYLDTNDTAYNGYFLWKSLGTTRTEILVKPAQSRMWCDICNRLHKRELSLAPSDLAKIKKLEQWWNPKNMCRNS